MSLHFRSKPISLKKKREIGWSPWAATCITLIPKLFLICMSALWLRSILINVMFPLNEAKCKAVNPSSKVL